MHKNQVILVFNKTFFQIIFSLNIDQQNAQKLAAKIVKTNDKKRLKELMEKLDIGQLNQKLNLMS